MATQGTGEKTLQSHQGLRGVSLAVGAGVRLQKHLVTGVQAEWGAPHAPSTGKEAS